MKLIDADALIAELHKTYIPDGDARPVFYHVIDRQPEAVVRCKDCIFYASAKGYSFGVCKYFSRDQDDTDYCNSGERR